MSNSSLQSDIDYMKALAEQGERGPLKNGATLFLAGLVYGAASIAHYAMIEGYLQKSTATAVIIWIGASAVFTILAFVLKIGRNARGGSVGNRAMNSAWTAVTFGIIALVASMAVAATQVHDFGHMSYLIAPAILILYGVGWWVSALMSGTGWLKLVSLGCFVAAPLLCLLVGKPEQLLAYAASLFLFAMIPGLVLMRANKAG